LVGVVLIAGVLLVVLLTGGDEKKPPARAAYSGPLPPIEGAQMEVEGLVYNVTDVRILKHGSEADAPYLTNLEPPADGTGYLGVFLRVYNRGRKDLPSAPGYLLEPSKQPGLVEQNSASESPFSFPMGATVQAGGMVPVPGSKAAGGKVPGALLLYPITKESTDAQPFDLVVHTAGGGIAKLRLPKVPTLHG
jgi:hypothetical protein